MVDPVSFGLPWSVGGVRRQDDRTLMVEVEHEKLMVVYARALVGTKQLLAAHVKTSAVAPTFYDIRRRLQNDINTYERMVQWLQRLTPKRPFE